MASAGAQKPKDIITAVQFYVDKIVSDPALSGMKALLLDTATTRVVSMVYSQTQILNKEVYLVEHLNKEHEAMNHLKAAVFVQPTDANFELIARELREPRFKEYHLFFSSIVPQDMLAKLGRLDEHDMIMQVQEYYGDYLGVNEDLFHLGVDNSLILSSAKARNLESSVIVDRNVSGILSVILALKKIPSQIRYAGTSDIARRLANEVLSTIEKGEPFDFRRQDGVLLLVLDRRDDPITPLLTQWTYQAMVHELLGLNYNRVSLKDAPHVNKELQEIVLSTTQDDFFKRNCYANFGDLGSAVKTLLDEYQHAMKKNENLNSIEDMQNFLERYPDFRSKSINVSKHVAVMGELSRLTDVCKLLDISELEQEIACSNDHSNHKQELLQVLRNPSIKNADKLRLSILFVLRYESYEDARELKSLLSERGIANTEIALLDAMIDYAGENKRAAGLFSQGGLMAKLSKAVTGVSGTQNVYTQHQPLLYHTLQQIVGNKLSHATHPPLSTAAGGASGTTKFSEVIIYQVGGTTYEEAYRVAEFNAANANSVKVYLGGSCIQNSTSFLKEIGRFFNR